MNPPARDHAPRRWSRRPPCIEPTLQDLHRRSLIDHRTLLATANTQLSEHSSSRNGSEALVGQPDRYRVTEPVSQGTRVLCRRLGRRTLPPGESARKPDHYLDHLVLGDQRRQRLEVRAPRPVPFQRDQGRREDAGRIRQRHPDAHLAEVHAEAASSSEVRLHHAPLRPASSARRADTAARIPPGSVPPPWARSGLPPPRPPTAGPNTGTSAPAANPCRRAAAVVATTKDTLLVE